MWRLWIVPSAKLKDKREFYRQLAELISTNRDKLHGLEASDIEMVAASHPAVRGLSFMVHMEGSGEAYVTGNTLNGFYLPEGIILRMAI